MHQLRRGLAFGRADAVDRKAVVGGEECDLRRAKAWLERVLDQAQPDRQRLELTQLAGGLAASLELVAQRLLEQWIGRRGDQRAVD